ncbi:uncharacterized protein HMPREF1541_02608 [Cyphellophora europaea CBS 101466]|uniref:C2H2-type domain-containing protein n=1 Tax=Cyphellophora europaea (strain CBS 101466) TaxID=1220924 RepID=W2S6A5_CYPE1|nr:uncharacterized protein HMPREF1541_02608 [Cyphellophora europaea CBS 101466]ETN43449.1 hypothetical protein HMPREF1541_02608 [Cyphellophora europaea CBS 101466]
MATETSDDYSETLAAQIARLKSPGLEVTEVKLRHVSESPPLVSRDSSAVPSDVDESGGPYEDRKPGSQGDYVLLSQLAPNNPDAAEHALNHALPVIEKNNSSPPRPMSIDPPRSTIDAADEDHIPHSDVLKQDQDGDFRLRARKESLEGALCRNGGRLSLQDPPSPNAEKKQQYDIRPPPLRPSLAPRQEGFVEDSLAKSPLLSKFTIDERNGDPNNTLAAMQTTSPPRPSVGPQEGRQTLPSLTTALSDAGSPFSAPSPYLSRSASSTFGHPLSSISSAMSPPNYSSNPSLWTTSRKQTNSTSTPSDYAASASTPQSAWTTQSPAGSLTTPLSSTSSHPAPPPPSAAQPGSIAEPTLTTTASGPLLSPTHQPLPSDHSANSSISISSPTAALSTAAAAQAASLNGIFRCSMPGCTAVPFQTQYLLNSHMNVHSDQRPHFCPVRDCPRGPGGQGFKRKNEMIRHGLVHTSPGYTCPFCPDQTHRYPRPDNLQRHVRVHHMEKDRDDPMLREVLAQRPEGGARGRRRRLGT